MTKRRWLMLALAAAAILLLAGRALAGMYADYLWYDALGAAALWRLRLAAVLALRAGSLAAASLFAFANLYAVRKSVVSLVFPRRVGNLEIGEEVPGRYLMAVAVGLSLVLGALLTLSPDVWPSAVLAVAGRPFSETDPYFGHDLGFFVYRLPFENAVWTWAFLVVVVVTLVVLALYALTPSLKWQRGSLYVSTYVRRHVTVLVGALLFMLAWSYRLDMYSLLLDGSGANGAFSYVDYRVGIPGNLLLALTTLAAALIVLWAGFVGQLRLAGISVITVVALSVTIREIVPMVVARSGTDAERTAREQPYLGTRGTFSRRAFGVDAVRRADTMLAYPSLIHALPWISAWDPPALARALDANRGGDARRIRIAWRASDAGLLADVVDPPPTGAPAGAPWTRARVVAGVADERGAPLRVRGPAASAIDDAALPAPLVYPGAPVYTVIADSLARTTGTPLEDGLTRLAVAWALQNFRILSVDSARPRPTIVRHRDVRSRIALLAPFFAQGRQVTPLLVGDSLFWAVDLYAVSSTYPLARHISFAGDDRTYLRHAGVAIVEASTGETSLLPDSTLDPIAGSWTALLPSLFAAWRALPPSIPQLLPPPVDGLGAQAVAFGRYGSRAGPETPSHVPALDGADTSLIADPAPMVLPGGRTLALVLPLVDDTDRIHGMLIGTGGTSRGVFWYPLTGPAPRWTPVLDRLRSADTADTAARDGMLTSGRVRVVPLRGGAGFVQPKYRWWPQTVPSLARIALMSGDTVRSLAPNSSMLIPPPLPPARGDLRATVASLYQTMRSALQRGDWVTFGQAFDELGKVLARPEPRTPQTSRSPR